MNDETYGRIAYEAYVHHCGGKSINGEELPSWSGQRPAIREHWIAAAEAVLIAERSETVSTDVIIE